MDLGPSVSLSNIHPMTDNSILREIEREQRLRDFTNMIRIYEDIIIIAVAEIEREKGKLTLVLYYGPESPRFWSGDWIRFVELPMRLPPWLQK